MNIVAAFYRFEGDEIKKTYKVFWKILQDRAPNFYKNLKGEKVSCSTFLFEWILTLYSSAFDIEVSSYIWD